MSVVGKSLGVALGGLRRLAGVEALDRWGLRDRVEKIVGRATAAGFTTALASARTFTKAQGGGSAVRQAGVGEGSGLFDLTPTEEQQLLVETFRDFAEEQLRSAASEADHAQAAPDKVLEMATELGAILLGIPAELGGVVEERSAVTAVLATESLAHGDMGLAAAVLAPGAVATALALWGDATQQQTYLTAFAGDTPPVAALAVMEPRALFDPFQLRTTAKRTSDGGFELHGIKAMVPRLESAELLVVAADLEGVGPALFLVESTTGGLAARREPTMGVRALASGELSLTGVRLPKEALLAEGDAKVYAEMVARSRLAWAALATGTSQAVLDYVIPYVKERTAFGEPIAHRQAVAFTVADIATELEGLRLATWRAAALADRDLPFTREAAVARRLAATRGMQIGSAGVQLLGGHGYVKEHPVERWYRDLRAAGMLDGVVLV